VPPAERRPALALRGARKDLPLTSGTLFPFRQLPLQGDLAAVVVSCNAVETGARSPSASRRPRRRAAPARNASSAWRSSVTSRSRVRHRVHGRAMLLTRREQEALPHVIHRVVRDWPDLAPVAGTASRHRGGRAGYPVLHSAARDPPAARDRLRARLGEELRAGGDAGG
jgi:hypothetical protein